MCVPQEARIFSYIGRQNGRVLRVYDAFDRVEQGGYCRILPHIRKTCSTRHRVD